ncbi:hypothetical protein C6I20_14430 [Aeromicrobium sp. A1-2]|nr:hypothetical protein C6I20_14430 [Aeromicrobium sp. A1-2]
MADDGAGSEPTKAPKRSFTDDLWALDEATLIQRFIVGRGNGDDQTALAILQAKAMVAARDAASETKRMAHQTARLAWATVALAIATAALVIISAWN